MVTPATEASTAEATTEEPQPEAPSTPDTPLVTPEEEDRTIGEEADAREAAVAMPEVAETATETPEPEATETPAAEAEEPPSEPPPRTFTQEEVSKIQSDTATEANQRVSALANQRVNALAAEVEQIRQQAAERDVLGQAAAFEASQRVAYEATGQYTPEQAVAQAEKDKNLALAQYQQQISKQGEVQAQRNLAAVAIAADHGLGATEAQTLLAYGTQEEMTQQAGVLKQQKEAGSAQAAEIAELRAEIAELKKAQVPAATPEQQVDSGSGAVGPRTDEQWLAAYGRGEVNDLQKAVEISRRLEFDNR